MLIRVNHRGKVFCSFLYLLAESTFHLINYSIKVPCITIKSIISNTQTILITIKQTNRY